MSDREDLQAETSAPTIDTLPPTNIRFLAILWLTTAASLAYLTRNAIGIAESRIRGDLDISLNESGYILGAFFWTYAIFQVPTGSFSHNFGTRIALTLFAIGWSAATFATAVSPGFWLLISAQLLMGIAQAGIFPASTNSVNYWTPMANRSLACGMLAVGMQVGAIVASVLTGELLEAIDWRWVFVLFALPGFLWAAAFYFRFRDRPELDPRTNAAERSLIRAGRPSEQTHNADHETGPTDWKAMLRHPGIWLIYGQQICRAAGYMFFASWFPTFLQETRGVSIKESGYMQGLVLAGALTGCLLGGLLTDWIWRRSGNLWLSRSGMGAFSLGTCGLLILGSWLVEDVYLAIGLLTAGVLFASLAGPATFTSVIDISGSRVAQVLGAVNMVGNFAAALCPIVIGQIFQRTDNWNLVLALFAAIYLLGAVCWLFFNPRRVIFTRPNEPLAAESVSAVPAISTEE
ncbi:MFS transporter [Bremerella cremea]|uniref:MFS transporter n=1 Tax=Bremerella cremea TaxID=1031537 RepID=A0A368KXS8_9BACT|nr:MFS transporter [Bremerella cremea]RCS54485.1 MFS transporter [Bremerella cremea]